MLLAKGNVRSQRMQNNLNRHCGTSCSDSYEVESTSLFVVRTEQCHLQSNASGQTMVGEVNVSSSGFVTGCYES